MLNQTHRCSYILILNYLKIENRPSLVLTHELQIALNFLLAIARKNVYCHKFYGIELLLKPNLELSHNLGDTVTFTLFEIIGQCRSSGVTMFSNPNGLPLPLHL